ncbi:MAG: MFS transporter, partial [Anaerolineae bacterium]
DETLLGEVITITSLAALLMALPAGYLSDLFGRKRALIFSTLLAALSVAGVVFWPGREMLYAMALLSGAGQSLWAVTMAPFLMENSSEKERTYLFSFGSGIQMASGFVGNWLGGYLPTWVAGWRGISPTTAPAYQGALLLVGGLYLLGLVPLFLLKLSAVNRSRQDTFAPILYARQHPRLLGKLILPMLITSIGAGLIMPFMNVFFRVVHHQPDPVIGSLFAWGSLAMGVGLLIAPPLAERFGKIQVVVVTQALSIPFLITLGFAPWFWLSAAAYYVRLALMNMSTPVYQTFVMEHVDASARATVSSLVSIAWNFGWVLSPTVSGWLQVRYGFGPPFVGTITLYIIAITLYWVFFWKEEPGKASKAAH